MSNLNHLRDYVLIDLDTGTILRDPRRVRLVHDDNVPESNSDSDLIVAADSFGITLPDFYDDNLNEG